MIYILHTHSDVDHCVNLIKPSEHKILTTNPSIIDFIAEKNILCNDLTEYITDCDVQTSKSLATNIISELLYELDNVYSKEICAYLDIPNMAVFRPLFGYIGIFELMSMLMYYKSLINISNTIIGEKINIYSSKNNCFFPPGDNYTSVTDYLQLQENPSIFIVKTSKSQFKTQIQDKNRLKFKNILSNIKRIMLIPWRKYSWFSSKFLFMDYLYDLQGTPRLLKRRYILPENGFPHNISLPKINWDVARQIITFPKQSYNSKQSFEEYIKPILRQRFVNHLCEHLDKYFIPLLLLHKRNVKKAFSSFIIGNSPIAGAKALIAEYFKTIGIPVILMQHGGNYGIQQMMGCHYESDYRRCSHFISYGFSSSDLPKNENPDNFENILPAGSIRAYNISLALKKPGKTLYDVIFPITNTMPLWEGPFRIRSTQLINFQRELLIELNKLSVKVLVKPFMNSFNSTCAFYRLLKNLTNLHVDDNLSFENALVKYRPRAMVSEYPSTPLFEAIAVDTIQIFQLTDPVIPLLTNAHQQLLKRAYLFDTPSNLIKALKSWLDGKLPNKNDNTFRKKYIFSEACPQTTVVKYITSIVHQTNNKYFYEIIRNKK